MTRVAVAMIVRDGAATIGRAIASVREHVDEVCILDTGSLDGTLELLQELAREPGATIVVEQAEWRDNFADARNRSWALASAACDWLMRLDCDDVVEGAEHLRELAAAARADLDGFKFVYDYRRDRATGVNTTACWRELLRRKDPVEWGWQFPVHEVYAPRRDAIVPRYDVVPARLVRIVHERATDWAASNARNLAMLERATAGKDADPRLRVALASELAEANRIDDAVATLRALLADPCPVGRDLRSQARHRLAVYLQQLGEIDAALEAELVAVGERDDWAENAVGLAELYALQHEWPAAALWARRALEIGLPADAMAVDPVFVTVSPLVVLACALLAQGRFADAVPVLGRLMALQPAHPLLALARRDPRISGAGYTGHPAAE